MTRPTTAPSRALVIVSTVVLGLVLLVASAVGAVGADVATVEYRVESGDTLWEIAGAHAGPGRDLRDVVYDIRDLNGLSGSLIQPGQVLLLPAGS